MTKGKSFVGFGFGAIQSGLFLFEAERSGAFDRLTVAEIDREMVEILRSNDGFFTVNIAHKDGVSAERCGPVTILDPEDAGDAARIIETIAEADEAATAVPSVDFYDGAEESIADLLARGLERREKTTPLIVYAAENHNRAAEILSGPRRDSPTPPGGPNSSIRSSGK